MAVGVSLIGALLCLVAVPLVLILVFLVPLYNRLVRLREQVRGAWAQIDVMLKRRYDLIPNLVETVKGYASHEKETLERVIAARNQAASVTASPAQAAQAEGVLSGALRQMFALSEAYPDLKANQNFLQLQGELGNTENQISAQRQAYNSLTAQYNTAVMGFPGNVMAGMFGFTPQPFFEVQDVAQREAPQVKF
jgi:LemA protein